MKMRFIERIGDPSGVRGAGGGGQIRDLTPKPETICSPSPFKKYSSIKGNSILLPTRDTCWSIQDHFVWWNPLENHERK